MEKHYAFRLIFVLFTLIFLFGCTSQETKTSGWLEYKNADLGISFKYPSDFKVYQADENTLNIVSDYKNSAYPLDQLSIGLRKIDQKRKSLEEIESMINPDYSGFIKVAEAQTTKEGREELRRQLELIKSTNPDNYRLVYGDKTIEEATDEHLALLEKEIQRMQTKRTYKILNKDNYDLIVVDSVDNYYPYYSLSDRGTFIVDHKQPYKEVKGVPIISEQEYTSYKEKFDSIIDSIKII